MEDIANYSIFKTPQLFLLGEKANLKETTKQTENPQLFFGSAGACFCVQLEEDVLSLAHERAEQLIELAIVGRKKLFVGAERRWLILMKEVWTQPPRRAVHLF